jgi:hypothetical protein
MFANIRYDTLVFSPDFFKIKCDIIKGKGKEKEKEKMEISRKCWYCDNKCYTFVSICELCKKYKNKKN